MLLSSKPLQGVLILAVIGSLSACVAEPARYTGGGTINSLGGTGRAQISFNADGCDPKNVKGNLHYSDKTAIEYQATGGVSFKAKITNAGMCTKEFTGRPIVLPDDFGGDPGCHKAANECRGGQAFALFDYTSTNPRVPGAGKGIICTQMAGPGAGAGRHAIVAPIRVKSGPYEGYVNTGSLIGNAVPHACGAPASDS